MKGRANKILEPENWFERGVRKVKREEYTYQLNERARINHKLEKVLKYENKMKHKEQVEAERLRKRQEISDKPSKAGAQLMDLKLNGPAGLEWVFKAREVEKKEINHGGWLDGDLGSLAKEYGA